MSASGALRVSDFAESSDDLSRRFREMGKRFYDDLATESRENDVCRAKRAVQQAPRELLADEGLFDDEQVWQQIRLLNQPLTSSSATCSVRLADLVGGGGLVGPEDEESSCGQSEEEGVEEEGEDGGEKEEGVKGELDEMEESGGEDEVEKSGGRGKEVGVSVKKGPLDDGFFSQDGMLKFLEEAERRENAEDREEEEKEDDEEEDEEEDDEDMAEAALYGEDGEDEEDSREANARFGQFFDGPRLDKEETVKGGDGGKAEEEEDEQEEEEREKTRHERMTEAAAKRIEKLERENVAEKNWTMRGEVTARQRPQNSLIEADHVEFELGATAQAGATVDEGAGAAGAEGDEAATETTRQTILEVIRKRIIDGIFDDVKPPTAEQLKVLDDQAAAAGSDKRRKRGTGDETADGSGGSGDLQRSTRGLAEEYEEHYKQKVGGQATEEQKRAAELREQVQREFDAICARLDRLTNFHFVPSGVAGKDMKVVKQSAPAIGMEEIAPVAVSSADVLAPEEVFSGEKAKEQSENKEELTREERKTAHNRVKRQLRQQKPKVPGGAAADAEEAVPETGAKRKQKKQEGAAEPTKRKDLRSSSFFRDIQEKQDGKKQAASAEASEPKRLATYVKL